MVPPARSPKGGRKGGSGDKGTGKKDSTGKKAPSKKKAPARKKTPARKKAPARNRVRDGKGTPGGKTGSPGSKAGDAGERPGRRTDPSWFPPSMTGGWPADPAWWAQAVSNDMQSMTRRGSALRKIVDDPPEVDVGQTPARVIHTENKLRLLHYEPLVRERVGPPVLVSYALINRPYILDLQPDKSVVRALLMHGIDVYLIDWGEPTDRDRYLELNDYVNGYIHRCVKVVCADAGVDRISLMGYCMGGTMTVMYASLHPERVHNLVIMAAPLDFSGEMGLLGRWSEPRFFDVDRVVDAYGNVPGDFLNGGYLFLDPVGNLYSKYAKFLEKVDNPAFVEMFMRMEKWVNDGIPLAGDTFRQFIKWCYQEDRLLRGEIVLGGRRVDPSSISVPLMNIIGTYDHLVPPQMSRSLANVVSSADKTTLEIPTGHIGLSVSSASHRDLWPGVASWLKDRSL